MLKGCKSEKVFLMRNPMERSMISGELSDNDHGSVFAGRAAEKIDARKFQQEIVG